MPQIINTNIMSLTAQRNLNSSQSAGNDAMTRLSSGLRINSAKDDAAGLAISTRFESQIGGLNVATRNAGDGVSLAQTAEGSLQSMSDSLSRLRELAVQSANATNSAVDRDALNAEAQQIIEEVDQLSQQANFNGVKLLDGSFQDQQFQTGANVGETIKVSIGEASINTLGAADTAGISSNVSQTALVANTTGDANTTALVAGDLAINGIAIGASSGTSDTASTDQASSSSISKAAAINAVSDQTGVTATADINTVEGTSITADMTALDGNITINDVSIDIQTAAATAGEGVRNELGKIADAINAKADASGVTAAVVTTDDGFRIDLTAADGRNVAIGEDTVLAAGIGLAAGDAAGDELVYTGNVTLVSNDGSDITLTSTTGDIDNAGFEEGTYSGKNGGVSGDADTVASGRAALVSGDLTVNGTTIGQSFASDDTASTINSDASAISVSAAINRSSDVTGVTAEAGVNTLYSGDITTLTAGSLDINGVTIDIALGTDVSAKVTNAIDAINAKSGQTGVTAEILDGDSYKLIAADGRNIEIGGGGALIDEGFVDSVNVAGVVLSSAGEFTLGSESGDIENLGLNVGTYGGSESGTLLKDIDISTVDGANSAITAVDNALADISSQQADLGAIQNRFDNTMSSNQLNSENLSAANSRIKDADFAAETAALSRASVLQQAGISILAQANAQPQQVLSLLG